MSLILFKDESGNIQRAESVAPIQRNEIKQTIKRLHAELLEWENALEQYDRLATDSSLAVVADDGDGHITFANLSTGKK